MYAFNYNRPASVADAAKAVLSGGQALAGGQTLLASMKQRLMQPEALIDLGQIAELQGICKDGNNIVIGAMTRHQDVANNAEVQKTSRPWLNSPVALATVKCVPWAHWVALWPTTTLRLATPAPCWP